MMSRSTLRIYSGLKVKPRLCGLNVDTKGVGGEDRHRWKASEAALLGVVTVRCGSFFGIRLLQSKRIVRIKYKVLILLFYAKHQKQQS